MDENSLEVQRALTQRETGRENSGGYGIRRDGVLSFIVDAQGNKVSPGYHEFEIFRAKDGDTEIKSIMGRRGGVSYLLKFPENEGSHFEEVTRPFHDVAFREDLDGLLTTKLGAMWYIVDSETGKNLTEGYHEIYKENGKIYGKVGAHVTEIKIQNKLSHTIKLSLDSE